VDKFFCGDVRNKCVATESNVIICCNLGFSDLLNIYLLILLEVEMSVARWEEHKTFEHKWLSDLWKAWEFTVCASIRVRDIHAKQKVK
jgi:hypothetical protein